MTEEIHLGYRLVTGEAVAIPLHHTMITGMTRLSGKTTTIEALLSRIPAGYRGLVFRTKRGEVSFEGGERVQPYYRPSLNDAGDLDWQYVAALLEASMRERMRLERSFIINAARGAKTLRQFYDNITKERQEARRGFDESVWTNLQAYMEIILPELERNPFAEELELVPGLNVMELGHLSEETQALVISACLQDIHLHRESMIVVIPEAWKFLPQARSNPVKWSAQHLIREGGASSLWLWLDSQDVTNVTKDVLKSVGVWIMGCQREINEVKRVLAQLPTREKPRPEEIMTLPVGHFWVATDRICQEVYVQPIWASPEDSRFVATGQLMIQDLMEQQPQRLPDLFTEVARDSWEGEARAQYEEALAELQRRLADTQQQLADVEGERDLALAIADEVKARNQQYEQQLQDVERRADHLFRLEAALYGVFALRDSKAEQPIMTEGVTADDLDELANVVAQKLGRGLPGSHDISLPTELKYEYQIQTVEHLAADLEGLHIRVRRGLQWLTVVDKTCTFKAICEALDLPSAGNSFVQWSKGMNVLGTKGWIVKDSHGLRSTVLEKVQKALAAYDPTPDEVQDTYHYLLAKLAEEPEQTS